MRSQAGRTSGRSHDLLDRPPTGSSGSRPVLEPVLAKGNSSHGFVDDVGRSGAAGGPEKETRWRRDEGVAPAVKDDSGDIAFRIKASGGEHDAELIEDSAFEGRECGCV